MNPRGGGASSAAHRPPGWVSAVVSDGEVQKDVRNKMMTPSYDPCLGSIKKYTFLNDDSFTDAFNVERVILPARKSEVNPVLVPEHPWEGLNVNLYGTVLYDAQESLFKMWYTTHHYPDGEFYVMYAISEDGLTWKKPTLGLVSYKGSDDNNIIAVQNRVGMHLPSVIKRSDAPIEHRYVMFAYSKGCTWRGLNLFYSPDGLQWTPYSGNPVIESRGDVWNVVFDEKTGTFLATGKLDTEAGRSLVVSMSEDAITWNPVNMLALKGNQRDHWLGLTAAAGLWWNSPPGRTPTLDEDGSPYTAERWGGQIYGMPAFPYADSYVGLLWAYQADAIMETQLAWSGDFVNWTRDPRRTTIIQRGYQGSFDSKMIMGTATRPLIVDDEIWVYYGGWDVRHHYPITPESPWKGSAIGLARWRLDGFAGIVNAGGGSPELVTSGKGGHVTTGPVQVVGDHFFTNVDTAKGSLKVELLDGDVPTPLPIEGFGVEDCAPICADGVAMPVRWSRPLHDLRGRSVRVRFHLYNGWLYSYGFR